MDGNSPHSPEAPPPPAPVPPTTTAPTRMRRTPVMIAIIAVVVLVLGLGALMWWLLNRDTDSVGSPVRDIDSAPDITWTFDLPEGAENLQWSPVSDDRSVVSSSIVNLPEPTPVYLIDLNTGEVLWELSIAESAQAMNASWVSAKDMPGTDLVAIQLYPDDAGPSTVLLVNRESGELTETLELSPGSSLHTVASGNAYLVDWESQEMSRLSSVATPDDRLWTAEVPIFEGGDLAFEVTERDGYALFGRTQGMGELPGYDWPLFFAAADIEDGSPPVWAPDNAGTTSFTFIGDVIVQLNQAETTTATGLDSRGEQRWHLDNFRGFVFPLGNSMYLLDHREDHTAVTRYNPTDGTPMWEGPAELPLGAVLTLVADDVVALISSESPEAVRLDPQDGALGHRLTFPKSVQSRFFVGSDRLYVALQEAPDSEVTLTAQPVNQPGSLWTATYPSHYTVAQVGELLVLIDHNNMAMSGLGIK